MDYRYPSHFMNVHKQVALVSQKITQSQCDEVMQNTAQYHKTSLSPIGFFLSITVRQANPIKHPPRRTLTTPLHRTMSPRNTHASHIPILSVATTCTSPSSSPSSSPIPGNLSSNTPTESLPYPQNLTACSQTPEAQQASNDFPVRAPRPASARLPRHYPPDSAPSPISLFHTIITKSSCTE